MVIYVCIGRQRGDISEGRERFGKCFSDHIRGLVMGLWFQDSRERNGRRIGEELVWNFV